MWLRQSFSQSLFPPHLQLRGSRKNFLAVSAISIPVGEAIPVAVFSVSGRGNAWGRII